MKRFSLLFGVLMIGTCINLSAQNIESEIVQPESDSVIVSDSTKVAELAQMPIYNPKSNAAAQILQPPRDIHYNMPIVGQRDTSYSVLNGLPNLGKDLPEQGPGDINKDQKADSTERK